MNPMMMGPTQMKPSYVFTTQLVRDIKGQEPGTIMVGKVDNDGKVDGIFIKKLAKNISLRATGNFPSSNVEQGVISFDLDIEEKDSMQAFKFGPGHFGFNMMQRVHPNLILGFDYMNLVIFQFILSTLKNYHSSVMLLKLSLKSTVFLCSILAFKVNLIWATSSQLKKAPNSLLITNQMKDKKNLQQLWDLDRNTRLMILQPR